MTAKRFRSLSSGTVFWSNRAQDGHTAAEEILHRALYDAIPGTGAYKDLELSVRSMMELTGLSMRTVQLNLKTLQSKLSIDVLRKYDTDASRPYLWRIYSSEAVLDRRRAAGLGWVQRSRGGGVRLVKGPQAKAQGLSH